MTALSGLTGNELYTVYGWGDYNFHGWSMDGVGDVNGDGHNDFLVGAHFAAVNGRAVLYSGEDGSILRAYDSVSEESSADLGQAVSAAGDLNGDGFPDFLVGSPGHMDGVHAFGQSIGKVYAWSLRYRVDDIEPRFARFNQPEIVSLIGEGFDPGTPITIAFDGVPATEVSWVSPQRVDCRPPVGLQGQVAKVTYSQDGLTEAYDGTFTYEGTRITEIFPSGGKTPGGDVVAVSGMYLVNDGTLAIDFGPNPVEIVEYVNDQLVLVRAPSFWTDDSVHVTSTSSAGTDPENASFGYTNTWIYPQFGPLEGGTLVTLAGELWPAGIQIENAVAYVDGVPAEVVSVSDEKFEILTPPVEEATGNWVNVMVYDELQASGTHLISSFMYTPVAASSLGGNVFEGVDLGVSFVADDADEAVSFWLGPVDVPLRGKVLANVAAPAQGSMVGGGPGAPVAGGPGAGSPPLGRKLQGPVGLPMVMLMSETEVLSHVNLDFDFDLGALDPFLIGTSWTVYGLVKRADGK